MAEGKQLSFQNGEVSPAQYYRSNEASYSTALSKLRNGYVQVEGGVGNRSGFINEGEHAFQGDLMKVGGTPGIVGFSWYDNQSGNTELLEYHWNAATSAYAVYRDGFVETFYGVLPAFGKLTGATPEEIRFTPLKNGFFIAPPLFVEGVSLSQKYNLKFGPTGPSKSIRDGDLITQKSANASGTINYSYEGVAPFLPVSYMVTELWRSGQEVYVGELKSGAIASPTTPPATVVHPHASMTVTISITLGSTADIKGYNLYRASGRDGGYYKLVGSVPMPASPGATLKITDYGVDAPGETPPTDLYQYGKNGIIGLTGVRHFSYYQQRSIGVYDAKQCEVTEGTIGASKVGTVDQVWAPIIANSSGAFTFEVPLSDSSPALWSLSMDRLVVITEKSVFCVRGGEQGILTPFTPNPLKVSEEGGSRVVEPKVKGRRGYFLNFDHSKLMVIEFGLDGNVVCYPISTLSEHLFVEDIHKMEVTGGKEDTVYLLRRDGKMIRVTMNGAAAGFSLIETDGLIENIYTKRVKRDYYPYVPQSISGDRVDPEYDALMAYIIRDGVRYTERMAYREDDHKEGVIYADHASIFGERLALKPDGSYGRIVGNAPTYTPTIADGCRVNVLGTTYLAGEVLTLESTHAIAPLLTAGQRLHIYYDDAEGNLRFIRFVSTGNTVSVSSPFSFGYEGYFESDVPTDLRDVETLNPDDKLAKQTRWLLAFNYCLPVELDGKELSIYAEGDVVSSPLNPNKTSVITEGTGPSGRTPLPDYYAWGVAGLPYQTEIVSMDLEAQDNRTLTSSNKLINQVGVAMNKTLGGFFGMEDQELSAMEEFNYREDDDFSNTQEPITDHVDIQVPANWNRKGRVAIIQVDPVPLSVLALYPKGLSSG